MIGPSHRDSKDEMCPLFTANTLEKKLKMVLPNHSTVAEIAVLCFSPSRGIEPRWSDWQEFDLSSEDSQSWLGSHSNIAGGDVAPRFGRDSRGSSSCPFGGEAEFSWLLSLLSHSDHLA